MRSRVLVARLTGVYRENHLRLLIEQRPTTIVVLLLCVHTYSRENRENRRYIVCRICRGDAATRGFNSYYRSNGCINMI